MVLTTGTPCVLAQGAMGAAVRLPTFDDLRTLAVGTAARDAGHGLLLTVGCSQDEPQGDITLSPSPLVEHDRPDV